MARIYGKLTDNGTIEIREGNSVVEINGERVVSNDPDIMRAAGYKLVEFSNPPDERHTVFHWCEDEERIKQVWDVEDE